MRSPMMRSSMSLATDPATKITMYSLVGCDKCGCNLRVYGAPEKCARWEAIRQSGGHYDVRKALGIEVA